MDTDNNDENITTPETPEVEVLETVFNDGHSKSVFAVLRTKWRLNIFSTQ